MLLLRQTNKSVKDNILTLLYVNHGNTDTVSWWDCFSVPEDFLFPPMATMVKLAGVQMTEEWDDHEREKLHKIIDESDGLEVHTMVKDSIEASVPEVELKVRTVKSRQYVGKILVRIGFVNWDSCQGSCDVRMGTCLPGSNALIKSDDFL